MFVQVHLRPLQAAGLLVIGALLGAASGCSQATSSVAGRVMVGGQPVPAGNVSFVAKSGMVYTAAIQPDGSYSVDGLVPGEMTVLVIAPQPQTQKDEGIKRKFASANVPPPPPGPKVDLKYADQNTSDLRLTVQPGANSYDPPLK